MSNIFYFQITDSGVDDSNEPKQSKTVRDVIRKREEELKLLETFQKECAFFNGVCDWTMKSNFIFLFITIT